MKKVVKLWNDLTRKMQSIWPWKRIGFELPSGRISNYGKITTALGDRKRNYTTMVTKGSSSVRMWGGLRQNLSGL